MSGKRRILMRAALGAAACAAVFLEGCAATTFLSRAATVHRTFGGVHAAYSRDSEVGIVYTQVVDGRRRDRLAWFVQVQDGSRWDRRGRTVRAPSSVPENAEPVPVVRVEYIARSHVMPSGARIAVFWEPPEHHSFYLHHPNVVVAMAWDASEKPVSLHVEDYQAWWFYPLLPLTVTVDVVTFPLQLATAPLWFKIGPVLPPDVGHF